MYYCGIIVYLIGGARYVYWEVYLNVTIGAYLDVSGERHVIHVLGCVLWCIMVYLQEVSELVWRWCNTLHSVCISTVLRAQGSPKT